MDCLVSRPRRLVTPPIAERIAGAWTPHCDYYALERAVFPHAVFPRAWKCSINGGPPACRRTLVAALRRHGYDVFSRADGTRYVARESIG